MVCSVNETNVDFSETEVLVEHHRQLRTPKPNEKLDTKFGKGINA